MTDFDPRRTCSDVSPLPPKAGVESRQLLDSRIEARSSRAALEQACALVSNAAVLIVEE